jgi:hypothetical protein
VSDDGVVDLDRYEWERILRRCVLPQPVKSVAAHAAQYANRDGTRIYPGVARLAAVTCLSERSVRDALEVLRQIRVLTRTRKGSSLGRQAMTDEHKMTRPVEIERYVHLLDPDESPESAACVPSCNHDRSPERLAGVRRVKTKEHRNLTTGTPAGDSRTPEPHDANTGTSCTPPRDDPSKYPPLDQREDQDSDLSPEEKAEVLAQLIDFESRLERRGA